MGSLSIASVCVLSFICVLSMVNHGQSAVISIDLSSEWIKIALVKPGVPMEIVLNKESKRKTAAVIALRNEERTFSDAAMATAIKYPKNAYQYLQFLIGLEYDNPLVKKYKEWFPHYDIRKDESRNTLVFQHSEDLSFTTEELVGMLLNYSRNLAQDYAGVPIKNVIVTVPPFFTQAQRRSLLLSAQLVGLNVLQIISDSAAAALNYGVFRRNSFNSSSVYMMLFDMGATSTSAAVIEYKKVQVKEGSTSHIEPQLSIKGIGFDRTLGGLEMDMRLRNHLAKAFMTKHKPKKPIYDSPRAMAKLLKEARRVKMVLSANVDHVAQIEGLHEEIDFSTKVTRDEFENMCADLFDRIEEPVKQALKMSDITLDEIESVMLVGGATRVPKVQEKLLKAVKKSELGKNLNTDEAPALGAVYQAASLSKLFRVKKFIVKETTAYPIQVSFNKPITDSEGNPSTKTITRTLFNSGNPYPQRKILTFNRNNEDFDFSVFYGKIDYLSKEQQSYIGVLNLTKIHLNEVEKALEDNKDGEPNGIKAHFKMDESGLLVLETIQSHFEYEIKEEPSTFSKITSAFSNLFGGSDDNAGDNATNSTSTGSDKDEQQQQEEKGEEGKEKEPTDGKESTEEERKDEQDKTEDGDGQETEEDGQGTEEDGPTTDEDGQDTEEDGQDTEEDGQDTEEDGQDTEEEGSDDNQQETEGDSDEQEDTIDDDQLEEDEEDKQDNDDEEIEELVDDETDDEGDEETQDEEPDDGSDGNDEDVPLEKEEEEKETVDTSKDDAPSDTDSTTDTDATTKTPPPPPSDTNGDETTTDNTTTTSGGGSKKEERKKKKSDGPKMRTVKVNITSDVMQMDWKNLTDRELDTSTAKLKWLQQRDEDKRENEFAKNSLESHIFEFRDFMYSEDAMTYSTESERKEIINSLTEAGEWLEEDGWKEETAVYKQKLRELKRLSKPLVRRLDEASKRPKQFAKLYHSINMSLDFMIRMENISDLEIFTEVEIKTLSDLTKESQDWLLESMTKVNLSKPYEDPLILASEIEDKSRKLDREIMYLVNKAKNYKPKKPKTTSSANATNNTKTNEKTTTEDKGDKDTESDEIPTKQAQDKDEADKSSQSGGEEEEEILALPPTDKGDDETDTGPSTDSTPSDDHSEL